MYTNPVRPNEIFHYGIKRRSGRYPWGSGKEPYQSLETHKPKKITNKIRNAYDYRNSEAYKKADDYKRHVISEIHRANANETNNRWANRWDHYVYEEGMSQEQANRKIGQEQSEKTAKVAVASAVTLGAIVLTPKILKYGLEIYDRRMDRIFAFKR